MRLRRATAFFAVVVIAFQPAIAAPGRLISARPVAQTEGDVRVWRIEYETRDWLGRPTRSTGVVAAPSIGSAAHRPVVAWAHGTVGIVEKCAPSRGPDPLASIPQAREMVRRGWVVVASDYPGLGSPGPHAYLVADAAAPAVLDSVRAARAIPDARAGTRFALWGHSQGGHAVLAAAQRHGAYAPELQLAGVVAVSPPTDLAANMKTVSRLARGVFAAFFARSWSAVYGVPLSSVANKTTRGVIHRATSSCVDGRTGLDQLVRVIRLRFRLGNFDFRGTQPWSELIAKNSIAATDSTVPLMIVSAANDNVVSDKVTRRFAANVCSRGARLTFLDMPRGDHARTAIDTGPQAVSWIGERFAGMQQALSCPIVP
jgi:alpha-beta hydrolase superfamily lysophospholipase